MAQDVVLVALLAAFVVAVVVIAKARAERKLLTGSGRLSQPNLSDSIESALGKSIPDAVDTHVSQALGALNVSTTPGGAPHVKFSVNLKLTFKATSEALAKAVAEREQAKGMNVEIFPPDATDASWRVIATKP